jgi:hypothetical protein
MRSATNVVGGGSRRFWGLLCGATLLYGAGLVGACSNAANDRHEVVDDRPPAADVALTPLRDEELRDIRGGFMIAGLDLDFAAQVDVFANNVKVATTQLVLNDLGRIGSTTTFPNLPPAGLSVSSFLQDGPIGLNKLQGVTIANGSGPRSFALHAIDLAHAATAVINSINGLSVKQVVNATLTINNFAAVQSKLLRQATEHMAAAAGVPDAVMGIGRN